MTFAELELESLRQLKERRHERGKRAAAIVRRRAALPQPAPIPDSLEGRKMLRMERAARQPQARAERLDDRRAIIPRGEQIRRLQAEVSDLRQKLAKR